MKYIRPLAECRCFCSDVLWTRGHRISDGQPQYDTQTIGQPRVLKDSLGRDGTCDRIIIRRRACSRQILLSLQIHWACLTLWRRGVGVGKTWADISQIARYLDAAYVHLN